MELSLSLIPKALGWLNSGRELFLRSRQSQESAFEKIVETYRQQWERETDAERKEQAAKRLRDAETVYVAFLEKRYLSVLRFGLADRMHQANIPPDSFLSSEETKALGLSPSLAQSLTERMQKVDAVEAALEIEPTGGELLERGYALHVLGRFSEAIEAFSKAIDKDPLSADGYHNRGVIYHRLSKLDKALSDYSSFLNLRPNDATVYSNRGLVFMNLGDHPAAFADLTKAIDLRPNDADIHHNRSAVLIRMGRYDEAVKDATRALELKPTDAVAVYNRACALACLGRLEEALADLEHAIALDAEYRAMARTDSDCDSLRDDPRFQKLISED